MLIAHAIDYMRDFAIFLLMSYIEFILCKSVKCDVLEIHRYVFRILGNSR